MAEILQTTRLPAPVRITEQVWPEGTVPLVSVFCITYNHVNFIRDAIEGFLMQETTFPVEIFIHDDASTDGTADIVREYAEKYPKLFWTVLQTENQWSKGNPNAYLFKLMQKQRGEFLALCEGDDYWIAKEKLQKQVGILENDNGFSGCCHEVKSNFQEGKEILHFNFYCGLTEIRAISFEEILNSNLVATCSSLIRKKCLQDLPELFSDLAMGDWPLCIWVAKHGNFFFDCEPMGFYRRHAGGVWSSMQSQRQNFETVKMFSKISHLIEDRYEENCVKRLLDFYAPIVLHGFANGNLEFFRLAQEYVYSSKWCKKTIQTKLAQKILESSLIGNQGIHCKNIADIFCVCFEINSSFKSFKVPQNIGSNMLAKSLVSQAWVNKTAKPFFAISTIILSLTISLKGTLYTLIEMSKKSIFNLFISSDA